MDLSNFQELLLRVGQALGREQIRALAFLCADLLNPDPSTISMESATDLFRGLMDRDLLTEDRPYLLADLLSVVGCFRLLRQFGLYQMISTTKSLICPYRKLLYTLSENITRENLKSIKFLLFQDLPCTALEPNISTLEVFSAMESKDLLSSSDLSRLEKLLRQVSPVLMKDIQQFKASQCKRGAHFLGTIAQETGIILRSRSSSDVSGCEKNSLPERPHSGVLASADYVSAMTNPGSGTHLALPELSSLHLRDTPTENESHMPAVFSIKIPSFTENQTADPLLSKEETEKQVLEAYPMVGPQRGVCWIVNNFDFSRSRGRHRNREGTHIDKESLSRVFKWLGFQVEVLLDGTSAQMRSSVQALAKRDHSGHECVVCVVLSHGNEGVVYGVDGEAVSLAELQAPLSGLRCHFLRGKPKLFFIQACQGIQEQQTVFIEADGPDAPGGIVCSDATASSGESVPCGADFLTAMATVPSCVSLRDKRQGSWFIQSLCRNLVQMVPRGHDLVSILTLVNADVSQMVDPANSRRQMPQPAFSLRKQVVFPVPEAPPPSLPTGP